MKRLGLIVLILSTVFAAVLMIPARIIIPEGHFLTVRQIAMIGGVRGTLWSGQILLRTRQQAMSALVDWKTSGACLFGLQACIDLEIKSFGHQGRASELSVTLGVPLLSFVTNSGCLPLGSLKVSNVSGTLSSSLITTLVPELIAAEQSVAISNLGIELDFDSGVIEDAIGSIAIGPGAVRYLALNQREAITQLEALSGSIVPEAGGFEFAIKNAAGDVFLTIATPDTRDEFSLVVYDAFAQKFGAGPLSGQSQNQARFEVSQKISDLLCAE